MSDLINRSELLDYFKNKYSDIGAGCYPYNIVVWDLVNYIEKMPTAYDLNSVIEQLEAIKGKEYIETEDANGKHFVYWEKTCGFDTKTEYAIEIVKNGCKTAKEEKKLPPEVEQRMLKTFLGRN